MTTSNSPIHNDGSVDVPDDNSGVIPTPIDHTYDTVVDDTVVDDTVVDDTVVEEDDNTWMEMNDKTNPIDNTSIGGLYEGESGGSFATVDFSNCNSKQCKIMKGYQTMNELNKSKALNANDLKPHETSNVPWDQPHTVLDDNIIEDRIASIGIATKSSSLRNANLSIRPDPKIQHQMVGPWNMSTITPDYNRKSLC